MPDQRYDSHWYDPLYKLRYGVGADEKHDIAMRGAVPGGIDVQASSNPDDLTREERRAAGYLFAKQHPLLGVPLTAGAAALRYSLGEHDMNLHLTALEAAQRGAADARNPPTPAAKMSAAEQADTLRRVSSGSLGTNF